MKKSGALLVTCLLVIFMVLVGCNPDSGVDKVGEVKFVASDLTNSRSLKVKPISFDPNQYWWTYTAVKNDNTGFETGAATNVPVKADKLQGLGTVGPFSLGSWTFTLDAYVKNDNGTYSGLAYHGEISTVIKKSAEPNKISVTVDTVESSDNGYLSIPKKILVTNQNSNVPVVDGKYKEVITLTKGVENVVLPKAQISGENRIYALPGGEYEVNIQYQNLENSKMIYAEDTRIVNIYPNLTSSLIGTLDELDGDANINATDKKN